jgi:hypothetical protein
LSLFLGSPSGGFAATGAAVAATAGSPGGMLINNGVLIPGGLNVAARTDVTGSFVQTAGGLTRVEFDFGSNTLDQVFLTGSAKVGGTVEITLLNPQLIPGGHFQRPLFSAAGGVTNDGLTIKSVPSLAVTYQLLYPGTSATLDYDVDFGLHNTLSPNLRRLGQYINRVQAAGSAPVLADLVVSLLYNPALSSYRQTLSQLTPDFYAEHQVTFLRGTERFGRSLAEGGTNQFGTQNQRVFVDLQNPESVHTSDGDYKRVRQFGNGVTAGFQQVLQKTWVVGGGFSVENNRADGYDGLWTATGSTEQLGGFVRREAKVLNLVGTVSYGWNQMDAKRVVGFEGPFNATVGRSLQSLAGLFRASHAFELGSWQLKPLVDVAATRLTTHAVSETGAGALSLAFDAYSENHLGVRPALAFSDTVGFKAGSKLRFYGDVGYQHYFLGQETDAYARFDGAPFDALPMRVPVDVTSIGNGLLGVQLITPRRLVFGVDYSREFSSHYNVYQWSFRVGVPF